MSNDKRFWQAVSVLFCISFGLIGIFIASFSEAKEITIILPDSFNQAKDKIKQKARDEIEREFQLRLYHKNPGDWHNVCEAKIFGNSGEAGAYWKNHQLATHGWIIPSDETVSRTVRLRRGENFFISSYKLPNGKILRKHERLSISWRVKDGDYILLEFNPPENCLKGEEILILPFGRRRWQP